jgi:hypothetical protein
MKGAVIEENRAGDLLVLLVVPAKIPDHGITHTGEFP